MKYKISVPPKYISIALHVLIWGALLLLPYFVSTAENGYRLGVIPGLFYTAAGFVHMAIFYGNAFYLYPKLLNKRFWWLYIITSFLLIAAASKLKYYILAYGFPEVPLGHIAHRFVFGTSVVFYAISIVYRRIIDKFRFDQEQKEKRATQLLTELKFLRSQISPHFLFNVLTNLVSLARKKSDQLELALIMLADLMRYMLYDTQGKKVPLQKEISYLNSYIALQQLRFGNDVQIERNIALENEEDNAYTIEPMLLIPFVENAFKHGVGNTGHPLISIQLTVNGRVMVFEVKNTFSDEQDASKDDSSGIGLSNVRTRLELLYKNKYTLRIDDQHNLFHITLTLKLI